MAQARSTNLAELRRMLTDYSMWSQIDEFITVSHALEASKNEMLVIKHLKNPSLRNGAAINSDELDDIQKYIGRSFRAEDGSILDRFGSMLGSKKDLIEKHVELSKYAQTGHSMVQQVDAHIGFIDATEKLKENSVEEDVRRTIDNVFDGISIAGAMKIAAHNMYSLFLRGQKKDAEKQASDAELKFNAFKARRDDALIYVSEHFREVNTLNEILARNVFSRFDKIKAAYDELEKDRPERASSLQIHYARSVDKRLNDLTSRMLDEAGGLSPRQHDVYFRRTSDQRLQEWFSTQKNSEMAKDKIRSLATAYDVAFLTIEIEKLRLGDFTSPQAVKSFDDRSYTLKTDLSIEAFMKALANGESLVPRPKDQEDRAGDASLQSDLNLVHLPVRAEVKIDDMLREIKLSSLNLERHVLECPETESRVRGGNGLLASISDLQQSLLRLKKTGEESFVFEIEDMGNYFQELNASVEMQPVLRERLSADVLARQRYPIDIKADMKMLVETSAPREKPEVVRNLLERVSQQKAASLADSFSPISALSNDEVTEMLKRRTASAIQDAEDAKLDADDDLSVNPKL